MKYLLRPLLLFMMSSLYVFSGDIQVIESCLSKHVNTPKVFAALPELGLIHFFSDMEKLQTIFISPDEDKAYAIGKKGQAPDEFSGYPSVFSDDNLIYCHDLMGSKINVYDPGSSQLKDILSTRNLRDFGFLIKGKFRDHWVGLKPAMDRSSRQKHIVIGKASDDLSGVEYFRKLDRFHSDRRLNDRIAGLVFLKGMHTLTIDNHHYIVISIPAYENDGVMESRILVYNFTKNTERVYRFKLPSGVKNPFVYSNAFGMDSRFYMVFHGESDDSGKPVETVVNVLDLIDDRTDQLVIEDSRYSIFGVMDNQVLTMDMTSDETKVGVSEWAYFHPKSTGGVL